MKGNQHPVGVFDSGLGGLSVLSEIHRLLPSEKLIYVGDSANAPYGDKSAEFVRTSTIKIADFFLKQGVKAIVIACNTATVETIQILRERTSIPIIGLEPAIKPACKLSKSGVIGVLATQRTTNSEAFHSLIERYADNTKVIAQACPGLVEQVETLELNSQKTLDLLNKYIQPLLEQGVDTLILGCTHYPFLLPMIREITGNEIQILETSNPVALQLQRILEENNLQRSATKSCGMSPDITFYNSEATKELTTSMQKLWRASLLENKEPASKHKNKPVLIKAIEVLALPR